MVKINKNGHLTASGNLRPGSERQSAVDEAYGVFTKSAKIQEENGHLTKTVLNKDGALNPHLGCHYIKMGHLTRICGNTN